MDPVDLNDGRQFYQGICFCEVFIEGSPVWPLLSLLQVWTHSLFQLKCFVCVCVFKTVPASL